MLLARQFLSDQTIIRRPGAPAHPRVSIVLPTYARNWVGLLQRAINSVLRQTMPDFELLIIDDGSRDGTPALIHSLQKRDARIVHVRHERNSGLPALRCNEGIELSRGDFITFQFDDDEWASNFLETLLDAAGRQKRPTLICGQAHVLGDGRDLVLPLHAVNLSYLSERNTISNNSVLVPREFFDRVGMYDPHIAMRRVTDWDLWLRLAEVVPIHTEPGVVAAVHGHQDGSIDRLASFDQGLLCAWHEIPRNHLLTPTTWRDYPLDTLTIGNTELRGEHRRTAYETQIRPYYLQHRYDVDRDEIALNAPSPAQTVAVMGAAQETDAVLAFDRPTRTRDTFRLTRCETLDPAFVDLVLTSGDVPECRIAVGCVNPAHLAPTADAHWTNAAHPRAIAFPEPQSVHAFEAACRATDFHGRTRAQRNTAGRPVVLLVLAQPETRDDVAWAQRAGVLTRHGVEVVASIPQSSSETEAGRSVLAALALAGAEVEWLDLPEVPPGESAMLASSADDAAAFQAVLQRVRPVLVESRGYQPAIGPVCRRARVPHLAALASTFLTTRPELPEYAVIFTGDFSPEDPTNKLAAAGLRWRCLRGTSTPCPTFARPERAGNRPMQIVLQAPPFASDEEIERVATDLDCTDLGLSGWELRVLDRKIESEDGRVRGCPSACESRLALERADLLIVMPADGVGQSLKDALTNGTLIVAADTTAAREVIADGITGLLVPVLEERAAVLRRAFNLTPDERSAMRQQAMRLAQNELHPERFASELFQIYNETLTEQAYRAARTTEDENETPTDRRTNQVGVQHLELFDCSLRYEIRPVGPRWAGLEIALESSQSGEPVVIHLEIVNARGRVVRKASAEMSPTSNRQALAFHFAPLVCSDREAFTVVLHPPARGTGATTGSTLRLLETIPARPGLLQRLRQRYLRGWKRSGLECRMLLG